MGNDSSRTVIETSCLSLDTIHQYYSKFSEDQKLTIGNYVPKYVDFSCEEKYVNGKKERYLYPADRKRMNLNSIDNFFKFKLLLVFSCS